MDRDETLKLLRGGPEGITEWNRRREEGDATLYLRYGNLSGANLHGADLSDANLSRSNLHNANLVYADLSEADLSEADLRGANLNEAGLSRGNLSAANLSHADLHGADLSDADLSGAILYRAYLRETNLSEADLSHADLRHANFMGAHLVGTTLDGALCLRTVFAELDLSRVKSLDSVRHSGPSTIGTETIFRSEGKISEAFLRGCGVPDEMIAYSPSLIGSMQPIQFYSCFISYSTMDAEFAKRLHSKMREAGLRVWFAPEDMQAGKKLHEQVDEAIRFFDKLLLVISQNSIDSKWVRDEIRRARKSEILEGRKRLVPSKDCGLQADRAMAGLLRGSSRGRRRRGPRVFHPGLLELEGPRLVRSVVRPPAPRSEGELAGRLGHPSVPGWPTDRASLSTTASGIPRRPPRHSSTLRPPRRRGRFLCCTFRLCGNSATSESHATGLLSSSGPAMISSGWIDRRRCHSHSWGSAMTIAACYLVPDGVVVGADSTASIVGPDGFPQHFDHAQKIFEVGEKGSLCVVIWGLGSLRDYSFRTLIAEFSDGLGACPPKSMFEAAERLRDLFWDKFELVFASEIQLFKTLLATPNKTPEMVDLIKRMAELSGGICLAGRWSQCRTTQAFQILYNINSDRATSMTEVHEWNFWACANIVQRLIFGIDPNIFEAIISSGKWSGSRDELVAIRNQNLLAPPMALPLREAIDWMYSMIYSTVKLFKHSSLRYDVRRTDRDRGYHDRPSVQVDFAQIPARGHRT